jgi:hypothetical protein
MGKLGFDAKRVDLIIKCVSPVSTLKINGIIQNRLCHNKVYVKSIPSLYIFTVCVEGLSALIRKAEEKGDIEGIRVCQGAIRVSHLFFMDGTLILLKDTTWGAHCLQHILEPLDVCSWVTTGNTNHRVRPYVAPMCCHKRKKNSMQMEEHKNVFIKDDI